MMPYYRNRKQKFESELISNCIKVCYKEVDIEASSLRLQHPYDTIRYFPRVDLSGVLHALPLKYNKQYHTKKPFLANMFTFKKNCRFHKNRKLTITNPSVEYLIIELRN